MSSIRLLIANEGQQYQVRVADGSTLKVSHSDLFYNRTAMSTDVKLTLEPSLDTVQQMIMQGTGTILLKRSVVGIRLT